MKSFLYLFLFLNLSFASSVCETKTNEILTRLVENHPNLKMSQEILKGSTEKIDAAMWNFYPTPSLDISARDEDRHTVVARLEQPLWTGGKLTSNYNIAISRDKENFYSLQETSYKLIDEILNILENYLQSKMNIIELEEGLLNLQKFDEMINRRIDAGVSSNSDKDLLNARLEQIKSDLIMAQNRHKVSLSQLELFLDTKIECDINLSNDKLNEIDNLEDSIKKMIELHPSLKRLDYEIETAKNELESIKSSIMPNLELRAEHREGDLYQRDYNKNNNQDLIYLSFNMTTNAGLSIKSNINAARIKINELTYNKQSIEKNLTDNLLSDYNNFENVKNRTKIIQNSIVSAQNVLDSYSRLFIVGKRDWLDLVNALRELMQYKIELSNLKISKVILSHKLALKNGKIDLMTGKIDDL